MPKLSFHSYEEGSSQKVSTQESACNQFFTSQCLALSTYLLPKLIGRSRALAVFLQGNSNLKASSPLLSGLFAELVPNRADVLPYALKVAHELAKNVSPMSVAITKSLVLDGANSPEEHHLLDSRAIYITGNGHDGKEGVKSYLEKREPRFESYNTAKLPKWLKRSSAKL
jgi:enoyl-CoA hydratase/carnithine racemase